MRCSVCIGTKDHAPLLRRTLDSLLCQQVTFEWEIVVADDGSQDSTPELLQRYTTHDSRLRVITLPRTEGHTPGRSRNAAMRQARGEIIVHQSDDVMHVGNDTIARLTADLRPGIMLLAHVYNYAPETGRVGPQHTPYWDGDHKRPCSAFYLGATWREDAYAVGGNDPDFEKVKGGEDLWFVECLMYGRKLQLVHSPVLGLHQDHPHGQDSSTGWRLLVDKRKQRLYCSSTGSWSYP